MIIIIIGDVLSIKKGGHLHGTLAILYIIFYECVEFLSLVQSLPTASQCFCLVTFVLNMVVKHGSAQTVDFCSVRMKSDSRKQTAFALELQT